MKKSLLFAVLLLSAGVLFAQGTFAGNIRYDLVIKTKTNITTQKVLLKNNDMKIITTAKDEQGKTSTTITYILNSKNIMYVYLTAENLAIKTKLDPAKKSDPPMQFKPGGKKIGTETIDGKVCNIYLYPKKAFGIETKMWIWRDKKIPVKTETEFTTTEYKNISFEDIPSSEFELPKGVEITEMKFKEIVGQ